MISLHRPLAMAIRDATAEACVAYLLAQLVCNGRDPAEAVLLVHPAGINWMRATASRVTEALWSAGWSVEALRL